MVAGVRWRCSKGTTPRRRRGGSPALVLFEVPSSGLQAGTRSGIAFRFRKCTTCGNVPSFFRNVPRKRRLVKGVERCHSATHKMTLLAREQAQKENGTGWGTVGHQKLPSVHPIMDAQPHVPSPCAYQKSRAREMRLQKMQNSPIGKSATHFWLHIQLTTFVPGR